MVEQQFTLRDVSHAIADVIQERDDWPGHDADDPARAAQQLRVYLIDKVEQAKLQAQREGGKYWVQPKRIGTKPTFYEAPYIAGAFDELKEMTKGDDRKTTKLKQALINPNAILFAAECKIFGINEANPYESNTA